jgi:hypothetical protein
MTTPNARTFLRQLAENDDDRARHVEVLRHAAALLTETGIELSGEMRVRVAHRLAVDLRDAAQRLCDHARVSGDGRCRYCETLIVEGA